MISKQEILAEIKRTTELNDGKPLGMGRFEKETSIKPHEWERYWARFSDAVKEAGFEPNSLQVAYTDEFLLEKLISLIRKLNKFPTNREIKIEARNNNDFPSQGAFGRYSKQELVMKVIEYCNDKLDYEDILELCKSIVVEKSNYEEEYAGEIDSNQVLGEVYLYKHGNRNEYKIGKSKDCVQRGKELKVQMPEDLKLIHVIKTDDPSGIEAYWHRRFVDKRKNGEWFDLNSSDIKAFKRWRRIV